MKFKFKKGDLVTISPKAEIELSYKDGSPPRKYLGNNIWVIDDIYERGSEYLNVSVLDNPYPGALCSNVHISGITGTIPRPNLKRKI